MAITTLEQHTAAYQALSTFEDFCEAHEFFDGELSDEEARAYYAKVQARNAHAPAPAVEPNVMGVPTEGDLLRFNGTFTFQNRKKGTHRTLRIRTQPADHTFWGGHRLVAVMTGTDNETHYTTVGRLVPVPNGFCLKLWSTQRNTELGKQADWMVDVLTKGGHPGVEILKSEKCRCCNHKLTNPTSIKTGIGPECAAKGGL